MPEFLSEHQDKEKNSQKSDEPRPRRIENTQGYAIFMLDTEGRVASWSANAEWLFGYPEAEILGQPFSRFFPAEDRASGEAEQELRMAQDQGQVRAEGWLVRKDGARFWATGVLTALRDETGRLSGFAKLLRDSTERRQIEEVRAQLAAIVESSDDAIIGKTLDGIITSWNAGAERIYGYSAAEVIGQSIAILVPPDYPDELPQIMERLWRGEHINHYETVRVRKDGRPIHISLTISPIKNAAGRITGASAIGRDITERRQAEQERTDMLAREQAARAEAEAASRAKDEFLSVLSHELRTPLTSILGWARMLSDGDLDAPTAARAVESILRGAKVQAQLVEDLLEVSRMITGRLRLDVRVVELLPLIEAAIDSVRRAAEAKGIRLQKALDPRPAPISGDPDRLRQMVGNLLSNAVKFTPQGGCVQIGMERMDSHVEIRVSDTGAGIPPGVLPHVFDRFRQADSTTTRKYGGLGLGLAVVHHLVQGHGGTVWAESPGEGKGTTFKVRLPLVALDSEGRAAQPARPTASNQTS